MSISSLHKLLVTAVGVLVMLTACTSPSTPDPAIPDADPVRLVANPWEASRLNATVATILLAEKLNIPAEVVEFDEATTWEKIAAGEADANLEIWPSGHHANRQKYIETDKSVEYGGTLGAVGKIGWYIPSYMLEGHQELRSWEGFLNPANAALFAAPEIGGKGQFLTGDPSWVQYDTQIIENLELNLEVVSVGSEAALLERLAAAVANEQPILMYFWTPHWAHAVYDLTAVSLPPYSEECYAQLDKNGIDCDYPPEDLYKIFATDFSEKNPQAHTLLKNLSLTNQDQIAMMAMVQLDGMSIEEAARTWVEQNEAVWQAWMP